MDKFMKDFPSGPLDKYRKRASFDWKKLKIFLYPEDVLEYQDDLYKELQQHSIYFSQSLATPSFDEERRLTAIRTKKLLNIENVSVDKTLVNLRYPAISLTTLLQIDPSMSIKHGIAFRMFASAIQGLGTERHSHYFTSAIAGDITGAYCLTEIGHGSNGKAMQTVARYDKNTQEFILHTPNFEAAKCWAGVLGQQATHAIVFAQLITPDGVNHSLHAFVVKIRNPETLLPYPGVTVGDMGEKIGLNGVDNGFVIFNEYRIPRTDLLNKTGDVTEDGKYITPFKDPNKRYGASLGALSIGRCVITVMGAVYTCHGVSIAIRYAAVRKQFGPEGEEEVPILEYQSHQYRLIPYLSVAYVLTMFGNYILITQYQFIVDSMLGNNKDVLPELGLEMHAISSASKPISGWIARDALQECREACGGHGYLKAAGIGDLKNANDANCTYEGENHVLIQQTSNWLFKLWPLILQDQKFSSPLKSINFLVNAKDILNTKFKACSMEEFLQLENILNLYKWLVCYLLKTSYEKYDNFIKFGKLDQFWAKNETQVYFCKSLAIAYIQHFMIQQVASIISEATDTAVKCVLTKLLVLYGVWSLEKHIATFYVGGYTNDSVFVKLVQDSVLQLCNDLKDDAVALVDVIAPPDFWIKSVLGRSDGLVYKHLEAALLHNPDALSRPKWWREITQWKENIKHKL